MKHGYVKVEGHNNKHLPIGAILNLGKASLRLLASGTLLAFCLLFGNQLQLISCCLSIGDISSNLQMIYFARCVLNFKPTFEVGDILMIIYHL